MAENIVVALDDTLHQGMPKFEERSVVEYCKATCTATAEDDTSNAYALRWAKKDARVIGWPGSYVLANGAITLTAKAPLGTTVAYFRVVSSPTAIGT